VYTDSDKYPSYADVTADFVYARLMRSTPSVKTGYTKDDLNAWAGRVSSWARGERPADLSTVVDGQPAHEPRDVYVFMIDGAKERAPAAAQALLAHL
jgi:uncharacterized protein YecE (DUF72 family)